MKHPKITPYPITTADSITTKKIIAIHRGQMKAAAVELPPFVGTRKRQEVWR